VIVIDEPMVGLDPRSARTVKQVLRDRVADGCAVLMSTHTLSVAEEVADRIGIIERGRLLVEATYAELKGSSSERLEDIFIELTDGATAAQADESASS
jgi:ABC-2 type transport system ATP-binding protein